MKKAPLLSILLLLAACGQSASIPPGEAASPRERDTDAANLLNIANGAAVVARTGEFHLEESALHAIDGMSLTHWMSPPGATAQTLVYSFATPVRIDHLGMSLNGVDVRHAPASLLFEASIDGNKWTEIHRSARKSEGTFLDAVRPFDARYLRITTGEMAGTRAVVSSFRASGRPLAAAAPQPLDGCWIINGSPARILQQGATIRGTIDGEHPIVFSGGTDGVVAKVMWLQGRMWGNAVLTLTPDGNALSGMPFHETPLAEHRGGAWFGSRCGSGSPPSTGAASADPRELLDRAGHWRAYGLLFDQHDALVFPASAPAIEDLISIIRNSAERGLRVVSSELREPLAERNQERSETRIRAVRSELERRRVDLSRVELVALGSSEPRTDVTYAIQRLIDSGIRVERPR